MKPRKMPIIQINVKSTKASSTICCTNGKNAVFCCLCYITIVLIALLHWSTQNYELRFNDVTANLWQRYGSPELVSNRTIVTRITSNKTTVEFTKSAQSSKAKYKPKKHKSPIRWVRQGKKGPFVPDLEPGVPLVPWAYYDPRYNRVILLIYTSHLAKLHSNGSLIAKCLNNQNETLNEKEHGDFKKKFELHLSCGGKSPSARFIRITRIHDDTTDNTIQSSRTVIVNQINPDSPQQGELAVCLAPIFGSWNYWLQLLQFFEWHKMQGAERFFVYFQQHSDNLAGKILDHYTQVEKIADFIKMPVEGDCGKWHYCRHEFQLQDCLYRTMFYRYRYVATIDLDELLVPLQHESLIALIRSIDSPTSKSFAFRCRWVIRGSTEPKSSDITKMNETALAYFLDEAALFLKWYNTTQTAPIGHTPKQIIKPETVKNVGVHHVSALLNNYTEFNIPPELAYVRHYRVTVTWNPSAIQEVHRFGPIVKTELPKAQELLKNIKCTILKIRKVQAKDTLLKDFCQKII